MNLLSTSVGIGNYGFSINMKNCHITVYNMVDPSKIPNARE